ncbi:MAG: presqualene diphosphate synthase HpnD [Casimicrobiaceae bacterium]
MSPDEYCRERVAQSGPDLRYSIRLLSVERRRAVTALHAYSREIEDAVRAASDPGVARVRLGWWRGELASVFAGTPSHPVALALKASTRVYPLPREPLENVIVGREGEVDRTRFHDFAALEAWCDRVAGGVAMAAAALFGYEDPATPGVARELGIAMELTRMLRDVGDDARRGRLRLPQDELARFEVDAPEVLGLRTSPRFTALLAMQAERIQRMFARALARLPAADRHVQAPGLALAAIHRALLDEIARDGFRVLERRVALTPVRKLWIATRTLRAASRRPGQHRIGVDRKFR